MVRSVEHLKLYSGSDSSEKLMLIDSEIHQLLRQCKMPSNFIELDYQTNPSFLDALSFQGHLHDLVLIRPEAFAELAGLGVRSVRAAYLDGKPSECGYLHHLRLHPGIRGGLYMARGYRQFREIFASNPVPVTLTSILEDNHSARSLLESSREGTAMPNYKKVARFLTAMIPLRGPGNRWPVARRECPVQPAYELRLLQATDRHSLADLFHLAGSANDGLPVVKSDSFVNNTNTIFQGLKISDFMGVFIDNELVSACGIWDQKPWKQIVVSNLAKSLSFVTSAWNLGEILWGRCPIPPVGGQVNSVLLDPWVIKPGLEKKIMPVLLQAAAFEAKKRGADFAAWGVTEGHPAMSAAKTVFFLPYWSIIYQVFWPEFAAYEFGKKQLQLTNLGAL